jgi:hypothetical protein
VAPLDWDEDDEDEDEDPDYDEVGRCSLTLSNPC